MAREALASCSRKGHSPALPCRKGEHGEVDGAGTATQIAGHVENKQDFARTAVTAMERWSEAQVALAPGHAAFIP